MDVNVNMDLFTAINSVHQRMGDLRAIVYSGIDVNVRDENGNTPLTIAIQNGSFEIVKLLLRQGADIKMPGSNHHSYLCLAFNKGETSIIRLLLEHGANIKCISFCYKPFILGAIWGKDEKIIETLFKFGADVQAMDFNNGKTLLHRAAFEASEKIVQLLLKFGADVNALDFDKNSPLMSAVMSGNEKVVEILFDHGAKVLNWSTLNRLDRTALHQAAWQGNVKMVELLLNRGAGSEMETKCNRKTVLLTALSSKNVKEEMIKLLLDNGADVHAITYPSSWEKVEDDYPTSPIDDNDTTTLHYAALSGNEKIFQWIFDRGVNPQAENLMDLTTLHFAAAGGNEKIVKFLLDHQGANVNAKDRRDNTTLHYAVRGGNAKIVQLMLDYGICVNSANLGGETPLHIACELGFDSVLKVILRFNPNVNATVTDPVMLRSCKSIKPIYLAVARGKNDECVKLLLNCGISLNEDDDLGVSLIESAFHDIFWSKIFTAEDCAKMEKTTILEQLLVYGVKPDGFVIKEIHDYYKEVCYRYCMELLMAYTQDISSFHLLQKLKQIGSPSYCFERKKTIVQHLVLLGSDFTDVIDNHDELKNFKVECEQEVETLKSKVFEDTTISYYNFMTTKEHNQLACYLRNNNIVKVFTSGEFEATFPIYALTLKSRFRKGMWRKLMLDRVKCIFLAGADAEENKNAPKFPLDYVDKMLEKMSNKDLRMMIVARDPIDGFDIDVNI